MLAETFKETEIGLIKKDWEVLELQNICNFKTGKLNSNMADEEGKYPFFTCSPETLKINSYSFDCEAILLAGNNAEGKFNVKHYNGKFDVYQRTYVITIKNLNKLRYDYLYYALIIRLKLFKELSQGTATKFLTMKILNSMEIPVPPLNIQKIIGETLADLDSKIELNQRMNQNLEEIGRAIFKHWFVDFEFPDEEGRPYKSSGGEMVDSELGEIPKGWEVKEIGKVIETTGGGTPSTKKEEYWENGDLQWFSPRDITANGQTFIFESEKQINELGLKKSSANLFPAYSVMMTSRATVGELSINTKEACTNQGFITCIPNDKLSTYYIYFWIERNKENIISLASGSTFKEINKSTFRSLKVIVPSKNIMMKNNSLLNPIFGQIKDLQGQNNNLSQIRDSLLPKLMSGKIRIKKQEGDVIGACRSSSASENP